VSVKTVESHRLHLKEKLAISDAAELVKFAKDWVQYDVREADGIAA
jgi:DNA-binding CsgD family transcriptional regulator